MPLAQHDRRRLVYGLGSFSRADDLGDVIDAGTGSINAVTARRLVTAFGNRCEATRFKTKVNAHAAVDGTTNRVLGHTIGSRAAGARIADAVEP